LKEAISELQINKKTENVMNMDTNKTALVKGFQFLTESVRMTKVSCFLNSAVIRIGRRNTLVCY